MHSNENVRIQFKIFFLISKWQISKSIEKPSEINHQYKAFNNFVLIKIFL